MVEGAHVNKGDVLFEYDTQILNIYNQINTGDMLQSGAQISLIVPNTTDIYKVTLYIDTSDIADIHINQEVKIRLFSLPYNEYGEKLKS